MRYTAIDKQLTKKIYTIEKKLKGDLRESILNKNLLKRINKEASILGKTKLICEQVLFLNKKKLRAKDRGILERIKKQLLYFYIELYKLNHKLHDVLITELKIDAKLLKNRINKKLSLQHAYEDFFYKLKNLGKGLISEGYFHLKNYHSATTNKKAHMKLAINTVKELTTLYELLRREDHVLHFKKLILTKTIDMFKELLRLSNQNVKLLGKEIFILERYDKFKTSKDYRVIPSIVDKQIKILHHFALNYNNYIIHSEPFYAQGKKHIIITHDVKPVF